MAVSIDLSNKVALVAAASQGIGFAVAQRLAEAGARLAICSRDAGRIQAAAERIRQQAGVEVVPAVVDVTDADAVARWVQQVVDQFGTVHIAVANAGGPPAGTFDELDLEAWDTAYRLTLRSVLHLARAVLPTMRAQRWGRLIAIESVSVRFPIPRLILSNALRLAVVGMLKTLAREVGSENVLVNVVAPGYTLTERLQELAASMATGRGMDVEDVYREWSQGTVLKRLARPDEIASAVLFLASDLATYITGQVLLVDGGLSPAP